MSGKSKVERRLRRKFIVRKKIRGTSDRPRLSVYRSNRHIYTQLIDDTKGRTLVFASSLDRELKRPVPHNLKGAKMVGSLITKRALLMGIRRVVFDRDGFKYHGLIKAIADVARDEGLEF